MWTVAALMAEGIRPRLRTAGETDLPAITAAAGHRASRNRKIFLTFEGFFALALTDARRHCDVVGETKTMLRMAALALMWGSSYLWIKLGLRAFTPVQLVLGRVVLGALVMIVICRA